MPGNRRSDRRNCVVVPAVTSLTRMAEVFGVFQANVRAKYLIECLPGFLSRLLCIAFGLFDTDSLTALGTFAEEMTGADPFHP
jgi:hypothetical protein